MSGRGGFPGVVTKDVREVRRGVAEASDAQVLMVVRMVDALEQRGASDAVLAPVRARLRALHPPRPLRLPRLLFLPLDPLIAAPAAWRPGTPFLPRTALVPLAGAVRQIMGSDAVGQTVRDSLAEIDTLLASRTTADVGSVRGAGALLWQGAAQAFELLAGSGLPAHLRQGCARAWAEAGLPPAELTPIAQSLAPIMQAALSLYDRDHRNVALAEQDLNNLLARAEAKGPRAWGMMLSLLVIRLPEASEALLTAAQGHSRNRNLAGAAVESALAWVEAAADAPAAVLAPDAASGLYRQAMLLDTLAGQTTETAQKRRLAMARGKLAAAAVQRYEACVQGHLVGGLRTLPVEPEALAQSLDAMEDTARLLRAFEMEARRLGHTQQFDAVIEHATTQLRQASGLAPMDCARLTEILAGTEAALKVLGMG